MKQITNRVGLMDERPQRKEKNYAGAWVLGILIVLAAGQAGYVFWQSNAIASNIEATKQKIISKEETIQKLTNGVSIGDHKKGTEVLQKAEESRIDWSIAQREINRLETGLENSIVIEDYTSDAQGGFIVQAVAKDMEGVALTLDAFTESKTFTDPFVTTISEQDNSGTYQFSGRRPREIYRFSFSFNFPL